MLSTNRGGRTPRYGTKVIPRKVGWPPDLLATLEREATLRSVRDGKPAEWNVSRLVVEDMAKLYGVDLNPQEPSNGR